MEMLLALMDDYSGLEKFFAASAIVGGVFFGMKIVLQFIGGDTDVHDGDVDVGADGDIGIDAEVDHGDVHHSHHRGHDSMLDFKLLSLQGLTAFFLIFGLVGLALSRQNGLDPMPATIGAMIAGFIMVWCLKYLFSQAGRLQSSGNIDLFNAIGNEGEVYLTIKPNAIGKARINIQNRLKIIDAMTDYDQEIKTGERIRVINVTPNNILVVEPLI